MKDDGIVVISTTTESEPEGMALAEKIVGERLGACVQVFPIRSVYRWQGKVEKAEEHLLLIKTRAGLAERVQAFIAEHHAYEVPEIVVTAVAGGSRAYLDWVRSET